METVSMDNLNYILCYVKSESDTYLIIFKEDKILDANGVIAPCTTDTFSRTQIDMSTNIQYMYMIPPNSSVNVKESHLT